MATPETADVFEQLREWASWPDREIEKIINDETIEVLQRIGYELADEAETDKFFVDHSNFVLLVRELRDLLRSGSISLGKAIIEASELVENNEIDKAKEVYNRFLASCGSRFYKNIAKVHLRELG